MTDKRHSSLRVRLAAVLIVLAGLLVYANSFQGGFVFDDTKAIKDNPTIRHLWPLTDVLFPARHVNTVDGRPLLNLSFALNYAAHGLDVWGYHAVNLAIHLLAGLTLFGIVRRTLLLPAHRERMAAAALGLALAVALIWVVHPLQTESVTYLCQRAESLVGLLYLLTLYLAIRGFGSNRPWTWQAGAVVTCALGMAAKEVMVTAPLLVLIYDHVYVAGSFAQIWRARRGFYLGLLSSWGVFAAVLAGTRGMSLGMMKSLFSQLSGNAETAVAGTSSSWWDYALTQFGAVVRYLRLSLWPDSLTLDYGQKLAHGFSGVVLPAIMVALLLVGTVIAFRQHKWVGFAGAWFFLILAPTTSVVPLPGQTIAEHRMYLPLAAVVVLVVVGGYVGWRRLWSHLTKDGKQWKAAGRALPAAATGIVVAVLGGLTLARNLDYRTEFSIMLDTVRKRPTNPRAHNNLGYALAEQGKLDEAIHHYERALQLKPDYADAHNNLGTQLTAQGRLGEAIQHFERALQLEPDYANAHNNLGGALATQGKLNEAVQHFERAVQLEPENPQAHSNLGKALSTQRKLTEGIQCYERALQLKPDYVEARHNLAVALTMLGKFDEAIKHYALLLQLRPDYAEAYSDLGNALGVQGKMNEAIPYYQRALQLKPDLTHTHDNLGIALASLGRWNEAAQHFQQALNQATAQNNQKLAETIRTRLKACQASMPQPQSP